ncbi:MAG TPA: Clp protease N-terminal domain-containing protein [Acidimicrobiales bacterium]|nr:Clp protease N-terminal domain-containing protein [Acidimicrobiales bacterium]
MFERFTDRARRVLVLAQEEARLLNHNFIGTEHILLGLIHEGEGVAAVALRELGISLEAVREKVEETIGMAGSAPSPSPPFTPRAKKVLELSLREALQLGHSYIGTEHMLLGLVREGEGVAAQVLVFLGADLGRVRQQVVMLMSGYQGREVATVEQRVSGVGDPEPFGASLVQRPEFVITGADGSRLAVGVAGRSRGELLCPISMRSSCFTALISARLKPDELRQLRQDLEALEEAGSGEVRFDPTEPWVSFVCTASDDWLLVCGTLSDLRRPGATLTFEIHAGLESLRSMIGQLQQIEEDFPGSGEP